MALGRGGHGRLDLDSVRWPDSQLHTMRSPRRREVLTAACAAALLQDLPLRLECSPASMVSQSTRRLPSSRACCMTCTLEHPTLGRCFAGISSRGRASRTLLALSHGVEPEPRRRHRCSCSRALSAGGNGGAFLTPPDSLQREHSRMSPVPACRNRSTVGCRPD